MDKVLLSTGLLLLFAVGSFIGCADNPASPDGNVSAAPGVDDGGEISKDQAVQIALAKVPGKVVESERETEHGVDAYEVEIKADAGGVKEVRIDPNTGTVLSIEDDDEDDDGKFLGIF